LSPVFIKLVHQCISTASFSILLNGEPTAGFTATRGIRQGCPLSPYLFVVAINELSISLQQQLQNDNLVGITLGPACPPIHSLLFADDLIICGQANLHEAQNIHRAIYDFCNQSGQISNLNKSSILFSKNVPDHIKNDIRGVFPVPDLQPNTLHLGHPLIFNHKDRNKAYAFIKNKFHAKFTTVKANKLNHAGRLTYIQSVLSSIPVYYMSTILFSKTFIEDLTTIIKRFWWSGIQEESSTKPIHFRSWEDICQTKTNGGLGIRNLHLVNKSLIMNAAYNIVTNKNPLLSAVIKAKYYPNSSFWTVSNSATKSAFWSSILQILQVRKDLSSNVHLQLHEGNSSIWSSPWFPLWDSIHDHLKLPVNINPIPAQAKDLWYPNTHDWKIDVLNSTFQASAVHHIIATPTVPSTSPDILRWTPAKDGICSSKAIYHHLHSSTAINIPPHGSRSITPQCNRILSRVGRSKSIPPIIKTFTWRLIRRALAMADRTTRFSTNGSNTCDKCNMIETDSHLFFHCTLPTQVWLSSNPSLNTASLPQEDDGIQHILQMIITDVTPDFLLCKILITLWYIWKSRNDYHFHRKEWTSNQVHTAVKGYLVHAQLSPPQVSAAFTQPSGMNSSILQGTNTTLGGNQHICSNPVHLQGSRCYVDVSTTPDSNSLAISTAGLGIFILNFQAHPPQSIYISAKLQNCHSVLMGEAVALALGAKMVQAMQISSCNFFSDSQQLVQFLHKDNQDHPPRWRMKPYTQTYANIAGSMEATLFKINRTFNSTAEAKASTVTELAHTCTRSACGSLCSLLRALLSVDLNNVRFIAASCCF